MRREKAGETDTGKESSKERDKYEDIDKYRYRNRKRVTNREPERVKEIQKHKTKTLVERGAERRQQRKGDRDEKLGK